MRFFMKFLYNFSASALLRMFAEGSFRSSEEIKTVDYMINYKIVFRNEPVQNGELRVYKFLQKVIDAVRREYKNDEFSTMVNREEIFRHFSTVIVEYDHFVKFGENEREVDQLNIVERRIIFAFKRRYENESLLEWLQVSLQNVVNYVIDSFHDTDRIGIVIKHETRKDIQAVYPIRFKTALVKAISAENFTLETFRMKCSFPAEETMTMQVVRLKIPSPHKILKKEYVPNWNNPHIQYM